MKGSSVKKYYMGLAAMMLPVMSAGAMQVEEPTQPDKLLADSPEEEEDDDGRIVGGEDAPEGSAPWQIEIYSTLATYTQAEIEADAKLPPGQKKFLKERQGFELAHKCGGSYIGGGWIITAAHCVAELPVIDGRKGNVLTDRRIRMGTANLMQGGATYAIERVVVHIGYTKRLPKDDIALIKVVEKGQTAQLLAQGRLAAVPLQANIPQAPPLRNEILRVSGWGWQGARTKSSLARLDITNRPQRNPAQLKQASVIKADEGKCLGVPEYSGIASARTLCVGLGPNNADACQGDSGGPLTRGLPNGTRVLVGIVSQGVGRANRGIPGLYTRVSAYDTWIKSAKKAPKGYSQR